MTIFFGVLLCLSWQPVVNGLHYSHYPKHPYQHGTPLENVYSRQGVPVYYPHYHRPPPAPASTYYGQRQGYAPFVQKQNYYSPQFNHYGMTTSTFAQKQFSPFEQPPKPVVINWDISATELFHPSFGYIPATGPQISVVSASRGNLELIPPAVNLKRLDVQTIADSIVSRIQAEMLHRFPGEAINTRPDGLSSLSLLTAQEYKLHGTYWPPKKNKPGFLVLPSAEASMLENNLGQMDFKRLQQALSIISSSHWKNTLNTKIASNADAMRHVKNVGISTLVTLRSDLVCPWTKNSQTGEQNNLKKARIFLVQLNPFLKSYTPAGRKGAVLGYPMPATPWTPLTLHGSLPFNPASSFTSATDRETQKLFSLWTYDLSKFRVDKSRTQAFGEPLFPVAPPAEDYENSFLIFKSCAQSALFAKNVAMLQKEHCVLLPVEPNRLFDQERAQIQCGPIYPKDTQVVYVSIVREGATGNLAKAFLYRKCDANGWTAPQAINQASAKKFYYKCTESQKIDALHLPHLGAPITPSTTPPITPSTTPPITPSTTPPITPSTTPPITPSTTPPITPSTTPPITPSTTPPITPSTTPPIISSTTPPITSLTTPPIGQETIVVDSSGGNRDYSTRPIRQVKSIADIPGSSQEGSRPIGGTATAPITSGQTNSHHRRKIRAQSVADIPREYSTRPIRQVKSIADIPGSSQEGSTPIGGTATAPITSGQTNSHHRRKIRAQSVADIPREYSTRPIRQVKSIADIPGSSQEGSRPIGGIATAPVTSGQTNSHHRRKIQRDANYPNWV